MEALKSPPSASGGNPWPGLQPYDEESSRFFFGRSREMKDLKNFVLTESFVLLTGASGYGKTSLINAGLVPWLRANDFLPVLIRLEHVAPNVGGTSEKGNYYTRQVIGAIQRIEAEENLEVPAMHLDDSLADHLQDENFSIWSEGSRLLFPIFIFDQFEEIFVKAERAGRGDEAREFLSDLADMIENRHHPSGGEKGAGGALREVMPNYKILIALRKEFLAEFEKWGVERMPSILYNRYHLFPLKREQAIEAVMAPSEGLIDEKAAKEIVGFASREAIPSGAGRGLLDGESSAGGSDNRTFVEPAILSLLCQQLNERKKGGQIGVELLKESQKGILQGFLKDQVEKAGDGGLNLLQSLVSDGYRVALGKAAALNLPGVTESTIASLESGRVIRTVLSESGLESIELVHDLLAVEVNREIELGEKARELRKKLVVAVKIMAAVIVLLIALFGYILFQRERVSQVKTQELLNAYGNSMAVGMDEGDYNVVRNIAQQQLKKEPNNAALLAVASESNAEVEDWNAVAKYLDRWERLVPPKESGDHIASRVRLRAKLAEEEGRIDDAIGSWTRYLEIPSVSEIDKLEAMSEKARLLQGARKWTDWAAISHSALEVLDVPAIVEAARAAIYRREWTEGLELFKAAELLAPNSEAVLERREQFANVNDRLNELMQVESSGALSNGDLFKSLELYSLSVAEYENALNEGGEAGDATIIDRLESLAELDADNAELWIVLGLASLKHEEYDKAEQALLKAEELRPSDAEVKSLFKFLRDKRGGAES